MYTTNYFFQEIIFSVHAFWEQIRGWGGVGSFFLSISLELSIQLVHIHCVIDTSSLSPSQTCGVHHPPDKFLLYPLDQDIQFERREHSSKVQLTFQCLCQLVSDNWSKQNFHNPSLTNNNVVWGAVCNSICEINCVNFIIHVI